jgi:hypothetical protein
MAVIDATKMWSREGGSSTSEKYDNFATTYSHTEAYFCTAAIGDDSETVKETTLLPAYGSRHDSGVDSFLKSKSAEPVGPISWIVTLQYEGKRFDATVDIEWSDSTSTEPIDRDYDGEAIVTACKEQVEGLTMEISDPVVIIRRKFFTFNAYSIAAYRHATNSDTFLGWPPGTARIVGYSAKNQFKYGLPQEQWDVTARIQFRLPLMGATSAQAWYKRWRHEGRLINGSATPDTTMIPVRARDQNGQEVTKPVLLNLNGTQQLDPNAAIWKYTQIYNSLPYASLGLL